MGRPLLTAAMIVRDEEHNLPGCLASMHGVVDELVVVDTGSSDNTVAVAEARGARVFHRPWDDDFSAPRNLSLDEATGRWILLIDADERLRQTDPARLAELLDTAEEAAFLVHLYPYVGSTPALEYRLWRHDPRIRFRDFVHARIVDAVVDTAAADSRDIGVCDLAIDHLGYEGDQTLRHRRNITLLQKQLAVEPGNVRNWRHLASSLGGLGRSAEAEQALEHAIELIGKDARDQEAGLVWADRICLRRERGNDVGELLGEGRERWPDNWLLVWVEAQLHFDLGHYEEAMAACRDLLDVDPDVPMDVVYPRRLFRAWPLDLLGGALFRVGRFAEAAEVYAAAEREDPRVAEYRAKSQVAAARAAGGTTVDLTAP
jgi:glycosyltransferase involved in cell wall biosynthesis